MIKAIIIDDEAHCRKTLAVLLKEYCADVQLEEQCGDAESGLAAIRRLKPDLVFLDIEMPHMNGFEMLEKMSQINFEIIFTTSYDHYAIKAIRFSALDYLLKPVDHEELQRAVQKVSQRMHSPLQQQMEILFLAVMPEMPIPPVCPIHLLAWALVMSIPMQTIIPL